VDLRLNASVILLLDPDLEKEIELVEREVADATQHSHEAAFGDGPEVLLLAVLFGTITKYGLMFDGETGEPLGELTGGHRRAIVAHELARQATLEECLGETVGEIFGGLREVKLRVTAEPRVVVQDGEELELRTRPLPARSVSAWTLFLEEPDPSSCSARSSDRRAVDPGKGHSRRRL
jgi:hypothetical protein